MLVADVVKDYVRTVMLPGTTSFEELGRRLAPLAERGIQDLQQEGVTAEQITLHRELDVRYVGQAYELTVPLSPDFIAAFHRLHDRVYGHSAPDAPVEVVNLRLRAVGEVPRPSLPYAAPGPADPSEARMELRPVVLADGVTDVPFYDGQRLQPGHVLTGPAVIVQEDTTVLLGVGDRARVDGYHNLVIDVGREA